MSRQLLRNSEVVIVYAGRVYSFKALSQFSASTSLGERSQRRKTLFSNTTRQYTYTDRVNATGTSLSVYLTDNYLEQLFFELVGLDSSTGTTRAQLPDQVDTSTRLFSMYIVNEDSVMYAERNFVQSIDISFSKGAAVSLSVNISSANLVPVTTTILSDMPSISLPQGSINGPAPIYLNTGLETWNTILSATISVQQEAEWIDDKSLFDLGNEKIFELTRATSSDLILSATIQTNYDTESSIFNEANNHDLHLSVGSFGLIAENARIVHNLDIQPIYGNRLDVSIEENTRDTYFYFGE